MKRKQILSNDQITARFSQASVQDLKVAFEELQALDRRHRAWSRSRRWAERLSPCISQMTKPGGFLDIVQPLASANEVAALTVGGLKAILVVRLLSAIPKVIVQ